MHLPVQVNCAEPVAEKGVLDLGRLEHSKDILSLAGEWEFYWKRLLRPGQFEGQIKPDIYGKVPSYWHSYKEEVNDVSSKPGGGTSVIITLPGKP